MTRDELEAVIWRHGVRSADDVRAILLAADAYADAYGGITAERRAVLEAIPRRGGHRAAAVYPGGKCGTYAGWNTHQRNREMACEPCLAAHREYSRAWRLRRRAA
jgi:hypothetical protein